MASNPIASLIAAEAKRRGLNPQAVLSVARVEGLGGGIGDSGTSFGPFQLHYGGAYPSSAPRGAQASQAWAMSPAGIGYALDRIAGVAKGLSGRQAVEAIVRRFERPADPTGEVAKALGFYGTTSAPPAGARQAPAAAAPPSSAARPGPSPDLLGLLNAGNQMFGLAPLPNVAFPAPATPAPVAARPAAAGAPAKPPKIKGSKLRFLEQFAAPYGVKVTSTTGGNHVKNSYHYRGRAIDVAGEPERMAAVARAALQHPADFAEMFYTGPGNPGAFIKNGRAYPLSQLSASVADGHTDHVHIAA